jgi:hypothetical protein
MRRRDFIAGLMFAAVTARAQAQQTGKVYRIAFAHPTVPVADQNQASKGSLVIPAVFEALLRLGYVEGRNLLIERYSGEGRAAHYPDLARQIASRNPDLIIAFNSFFVLDLKAVTSAVPIVGTFARLPRLPTPVPWQPCLKVGSSARVVQKMTAPGQLTVALLLANGADRGPAAGACQIIIEGMGDGRPAAALGAKSKTCVGRPLHPYRAVLLVTFGGNIQDPISRWPSGKRTKVRYGLCRHRYAVFHLDLRFPGAAAEASSHVVGCPGGIFHRRFCVPVKDKACAIAAAAWQKWRQCAAPRHA